jgi:hypothetical protein
LSRFSLARACVSTDNRAVSRLQAEPWKPGERPVQVEVGRAAAGRER